MDYISHFLAMQEPLIETDLKHRFHSGEDAEIRGEGQDWE
jgi:hypothetical protein